METEKKGQMSWILSYTGKWFSLAKKDENKWIKTTLGIFLVDP